MIVVNFPLVDNDPFVMWHTQSPYCNAEVPATDQYSSRGQAAMEQNCSQACASCLAIYICGRRPVGTNLCRSLVAEVDFPLPEILLQFGVLLPAGFIHRTSDSVCRGQAVSTNESNRRYNGNKFGLILQVDRPKQSRLDELGWSGGTFTRIFPQRARGDSSLEKTRCVPTEKGGPEETCPVWPA